MFSLRWSTREVLVILTLSFGVCWHVVSQLLFIVDDLGSLFEKKDFKDRPRQSGVKSTLSLRLEQCPQQLNNPFNEYSKFDGKVSDLFVTLYTASVRRQYLHLTND